MRVLFLEKYCPGSFRTLLAWVQGQKKHEALFMSEYRRKDFIMGNVVHVPVRVGRRSGLAVSQDTSTEDAVAHISRRADVFAQAMRRLKTAGLIPDVICSNGSNACGLYAADIFPGVPQIGALEWYVQPQSAYTDDMPAPQSSIDTTGARIRAVFQLAHLQACDALMTGTASQRDSYPEPWRSRMTVLPEGVDTEFFSPGPSPLRIAEEAEGQGPLVTYISRTLSPHSGFDTLYKALPQLFAARPDCRVFIVGHPAKKADGEEDFFTHLVSTTPVDKSKVRFAKFCSREEYRALLRASDAHVFLSRAPRALPSGLLEAMSCGCLLIASDSAATSDVLRNEETALLTDVNDPDALAANIIRALAEKDALRPLRDTARERIVAQHNMTQCVQKYADFVGKLLH